MHHRNPYAAPAADHPSDDLSTFDPEDFETALAKVKIRPLAIAAVICSMLAGLLLLLNGLQMLMLVTIIGSLWLKTIPGVMLLLGVAFVVLGIKVYAQRMWAVIGLTVGATLGALAGSLWVMFSFTHGLFSLIALLVVPMLIAAAILAGLSIPAVRQTVAIREVMARADLGIDF